MTNPLTTEEKLRIHQILNDKVFDDDDEWMPTFNELFNFTKAELLDIISTFPKKPKTKKEILGLFLTDYCNRNDIPLELENFIRVRHLKLKAFWMYD